VPLFEDEWIQRSIVEQGIKTTQRNTKNGGHSFLYFLPLNGGHIDI